MKLFRIISGYLADVFAYMHNQGLRISLRIAGVCLYILALMCLTVAILETITSLFAIVLVFSEKDAHLHLIGFVGGSVSILFCLIGMWFFRKWSLLAFRKRAETKEFVSLTQTNLYFVPASESLVRSSLEPTQKQTSTLLRATMPKEERLEHELLRATGKQSDST